MDVSDEFEVNMVVYCENWCLMLEGLLKVGFIKFVLFDGVFYVYVDVSDFIDDSCVFVVEVLEKVKVVVISGLDFDWECGYGMLCFFYVCFSVDIVEGLVWFEIFMCDCGYF